MGFGCARPSSGGGRRGGVSVAALFGNVSGKISTGAPGEPGLTEFQGPRVELLGRSQGFNGAGLLRAGQVRGSCVRHSRCAWRELTDPCPRTRPGARLDRGLGFPSVLRNLLQGEEQVQHWEWLL